MPAALVLRGYSYCKQEGRHGTDWRKCVASHRTHLLAPLRHRYGSCDVILVTYDTIRGECPDDDLTSALVRDYGADVLVVSQQGPTQVNTATLALDTAIRAHDIRRYDLVVLSRFDLKYLKCPLDHGTFAPGKINFLWREWNQQAWDDHKRVPDAVQMIPGDLLGAFREGVVAAPSNRCLHLVWYPTARALGGEDRLHVMDPEGFTDSNTDVMDNPVYRIIRT